MKNKEKEQNHPSEIGEPLFITEDARNTRSCSIDRALMLEAMEKVLHTAVDTVEKNNLVIACTLHNIDVKELYPIRNTKSIIDYANMIWGLCKTQTYNYLRVIKFFGDIQPDGTCNGIKAEFAEYSISQLIKMTQIDEKDYPECSPEMTVRQLDIRVSKCKADKKAKAAAAPLTDLSGIPEITNADAAEKSDLPPENRPSGEPMLTYSVCIQEVRNAQDLAQLAKTIDSIRQSIRKDEKKQTKTYYYKILRIPCKE